MIVGTKQKLAFQIEELSLTINSEQLQHSSSAYISVLHFEILKGRSFIYKTKQ
jgi:hypothetical protein